MAYQEAIFMANKMELFSLFLHLPSSMFSVEIVCEEPKPVVLFILMIGTENGNLHETVDELMLFCKRKLLPEKFS